MKYPIKHLIFIILVSVMLAACATLSVFKKPAILPPYNYPMSWHARSEQLTRIQNWHIEGVLGVQMDTQALTANLVWQQYPLRYQIHVFGPLNIGSIRIQGMLNQVSLTRSDGKTITASTPERLMQRELNWHLPVSNLYYWIRGLPAPKKPYQAKFDAYHHISELQQDGWDIQYLQYVGAMSKTDLPGRLYLTHKNLRLKIVISQWE